MKLAIVGSRNLVVTGFTHYFPYNTTEIVSGGAKGVDAFAKEYALKNSLKYTEFLPEYEKYGRAAPLKRNDLIIDYADLVFIFWDGKSKGTEYVIKQCRKKKKNYSLFISENIKAINSLTFAELTELLKSEPSRFGSGDLTCIINKEPVEGPEAEPDDEYLEFISTAASLLSAIDKAEGRGLSQEQAERLFEELVKKLPLFDLNYLSARKEKAVPDTQN